MAKIALLTLIVVGVGAVILVQQRQIHQLTLSNRELRNQLDQTCCELEEIRAAREQLRSAASKYLTERGELLQLRDQVARLRRELVSTALRSEKVGGS